jgi:Flp pilus assembly protein TadD
VHLDLGILAADAGQNDEALRQLLLADRQQPSEVSVHMRLGRLYKTMGKTAEARVEFDKASKLTNASDEVLVRQMRPKNPPAEPAAAPQ